MSEPLQLVGKLVDKLDRIADAATSGTFLMGIGAGYNGVSGSVGSSGSGNGQFNQPGGIAIDSNGNIGVVDSGNDRVQEFKNDGTYLSQFGSPGYTNGKLSAPDGIAIDKSGNVLVYDNGNDRVQEFTSGGTWLQTIPSGCPNTGYPTCPASTSSGQFDNDPSNNTYGSLLAIDGSGNVWAADAYASRLQEFKSDGTFLMGVGHWSLHKSYLISGYRVKIGIKLHEVSACRSDNAINRRKTLRKPHCNHR